MARVESAAFVAVLALLLSAMALDLTGHRLFVVAGASMEPAIPNGALVVVRPAAPASVAVGDVVTFTHRGVTVTHRVAAIDDLAGRRVFTTKGDANDAADPEPVSFDDQAGLLAAQVPLAGYLLALLQAYGRVASLAIAVVLAVWAVRRSRPHPFPASAPA